MLIDPIELPPPTKYWIVRDDREKPGKGWHFPPSETCAGTTIARLATGDYTIKGLEDVICVERKASTLELSANFFAQGKRFRAELERMASFTWAVVVCEFPLSHLAEFPNHEQIGRKLKSRLKIDAARLLKRLDSLQREYPHVQWVFEARHAERRAERFFDRIWTAHCRGELAIPSIADIAIPPNSSSPLQDLRSFHGETPCPA